MVGYSIKLQSFAPHENIGLVRPYFLGKIKSQFLI